MTLIMLMVNKKTGFMTFLWSTFLRRPLLFAPMLTILVSLFVAAAPVGAQDSSQIRVIDKTRMEFRGAIYTDRDPYDTENEWLGGPNSCQHTMKIDDFNGNNPRGRVQLQEVDDFGDCNDNGSEITNIALNPANQRFVLGYRVDADNIFLPIGIGLNLSGSCDPNTISAKLDTPITFRRPAADQREQQNQYFGVNEDGTLNRLVFIETSSDGSASLKGIGCPRTILTFRLANGGANTPIPPEHGGDSQGNPTGSTDGTTNEDDSCESKSGAMGWILCPVINLLDGALNFIDTQIQRMIEIDRSKYTNAQLEQAWRTIRNIAYVILIPVMLVMVISTALGFEFISAYTVKKALPRLIAAVLFIALSWDITVFLVDFFNSVGSGTLGLMTAPFREQMPPACQDSVTLSCLFSVDSGVNGGGVLRSILFLPTAVVSIVGVLVLLILFGSAFVVTIAGAFVVLLVRQMFIVGLILLAPLAILAWIFPGNDKLWKAWWSMFSKLLIMFPLIMGLIGLGRIFAMLVNFDQGAGAEGNILTPIMKLAAYLIPYALIPFTFKFAGGVFATFAGMEDSFLKGGAKRRAEKRAQRVGNFGKRLESGSLLKGAAAGSFGSRINSRAQRLANMKNAGLRPSRWGDNITTAIADKEWEHALEAAEKIPGGKALFASDDHMMAGLQGGGDYDKTFAYLAKKKEMGGAGWTEDQARLGASQIIRMRREMGAEAFNLAALAKLPGTGTAFVGEKAGDWHRLVAEHTHGNKSLQASLVAQGKAGFRNAQRYEVSEAGFGDHLNAISDAEAGVDTAQISRNLADAAYKGGGPAAVVGARNDKSAEMFAGAILRDLKKAAVSGDETQMMRALAGAASVQDQSAGGKRLVTDVLAKEIMGFEVNGRTVLEQINDARDNPIFQQSRRELGRDIPPELRAELAKQGQQPQAPGSGLPGGNIGGGPTAPL